MYYEDILEDYLKIVAMESKYELHNYEIATEANGEGSVLQNAANKAATGIKDMGRDILEAIQNAIEFLQSQYAAALTKIKNRAKKLLVSEKGYQTKLRERERTVKPLRGIKVTTYEYLDPWINTVTGKFRTTVIELMREITNCANPRNPSPPQNEILSVGTDKVVSEVIKKVFNTSDATDVPSLFRYMQNQYRGKKKEKVYTQQQLPQFIKLAESHDGISAQLTRYLTEARSFYDTMRGYRNQISGPGISDEQKRDFLTLLNKGTKIFNAYRAFLDYVYELRVEKSMNYRVIVQKFYQF